MTKTMVEFFSGSKTMSDTFKQRGYEVFTIDNNPELKPDLCMDILDFTIDMLPGRFTKPDVAWFSPPCIRFSVCVISKHWRNGKPKTSQCYYSLALVVKSKEIIEELKPNFWFIENPVGMLRKQHFMLNLPRKTLTYCQYGEKYQKPTDIWTNLSSWIPKRCRAGSDCHEYQPRTYESKIKYGVVDLGVQGLANSFERGKIPKTLCHEIINACEGNLKEEQKVLTA